MIRYWHWLVAQKKEEELLTEYVVRGTAINNAEFSPDYDGYDDYVSELDRSYVGYYYDTDNIKKGETIKVYYYYDYDYQPTKIVYCYIENGEVIEYIPPKPTYVNGITFKVKFKTDGVEDDDYTQISCDISPEGNWEFTYPLNKKICSLDEFRNESNYSYTSYGVINDGDATLLSVNFSNSDGLESLYSMNNAFKGCYKLQTITFGKTSLPSLELASDAFFDCNLIPSAITKVLSAPNLVGDVGEYSFFSGMLHYSIITNNNVSTLRVDGYDKDLVNANIPTSLNIKSGLTLSITQLRATPFVGRAVFLNSNIESVVIPNTITAIGIRAFENCYNLTSVSISNSVTTIKDNAFLGCRGLTEIEIPNSVTNIGDGTFCSCTNLTSVTLSNNITQLGTYDFNRSIDSDADWLDEYHFYDIDRYSSFLNHAEIQVGTFNGCTSLESITIPNSVTIIGDYAFSSCSNLWSIIIPNALTHIGNNAFWFCSSITTLTLPNTVTHIGNNAFEYCENMTSIDLPNGLLHIGSYAFFNSGLTYQEFLVPTSLMEIGSCAFNDCNFTDVVFQNLEHLCRIKYGDVYENLTYPPVSLPKIYMENRNITEITIPNTLTSIVGVFNGCTNLTSVTIPSSITNIGYLAFKNCTNLTKATFASIGDLLKINFWTSYNTFYGVFHRSDNPLYYAKHLYIGNNEVTTINNIPSNITSIKVSAFINCKYITSITLPNSITSIEAVAFYGCSGLTEIEIPNSVTYIGAFAFYDCSGLRVVKIPSSVTTIDITAFNNSNITFYCEASERPDDWCYQKITAGGTKILYWNSNLGNVVWGATW